MTLYHTNFVTWTKQQAQLLRSMPATDKLDIVNLVDEIEGLGRSAIAELEAAIRRTLGGLIDLSREPGSVDIDVIYNAQSDAIMRAENGVRRHIDLKKVWRIAVRSMPEFPDECPFSLEQLIAEDFEVGKALLIIRP